MPVCGDRDRTKGTPPGHPVVLSSLALLPPSTALGLELAIEVPPASLCHLLVVGTPLCVTL